MKVLCIKQGEWIPKYATERERGPVYGEVCTVIEEDEHGYTLVEHHFRKDGRERSFARLHFIPLSSIDETEKERNYKTEKV